MTNPYYNATSTPGTGAPGASAPIRGEFALIAAGFALLPAVSGNAGKVVIVNPGETGLTVTTGTLALAGNFATTGAFNTTLAQTASVILTLPAVTGTLATLAGTETLSNKTLVAPALGTPASGVLTNCTGTASGLTAGNVTTNANLTGPITSSGNVTSVAAQTGTGSTFVMNTSPTLATPVISGGTIDNAVIGGTTRATVNGTTANFNNTLTLANGATWGTTGFSDIGAYTTASTAVFVLGPTWNFSSTGNGIFVAQIAPTLVPTGASAGAISTLRFNPGIGTSTVNISDWRNIRLQITTNAGYSGVITSAEALYIDGPGVNGTNAIGTYTSIFSAAVTNGNGITTGTVINLGLDIAAFSAAAGAGGAVINAAARLAVPGGSSAGNIDRALWITGNGGAASTKYAIYSDSTAPSRFAGKVSTGGGAVLLGTIAALTNNAAAQTATMTNGPVAGNPTLWAAIDDNGTTRYFPLW